MATPDLPPWAVTTQIIRITSSASRASAAVRHFHRSPVRRSNLEARDRRSGGRLARMAATSWRPKKKERCTMSSSGMMLPLVSGTSSYSRCAKAGRGGSRASSSSLPHTGRTVGPAAPRASSATAPRNCTSPCASAIVWCSRTPRMKPPHARRVTCTPHTYETRTPSRAWKRRSGEPRTSDEPGTSKMSSSRHGNGGCSSSPK
uniref:Uncharacterized protein n=1 Tax=Zea mays TaxID=4577 RepID=B4FF13_MAIZE|nr:unknown [Zea mays]